ncbi:MAG: hypothetical protein WD648_14140 [Planctomycetaceae bacterium]
MERIEPLLRYKFWISFVAAILLPAVGWYLATGSMSTEVDKRWKVVDGNFNKGFIKGSTRDSEIAKIPNNKYIEGIKVINAAHAKDLQQARANLRNAQKQYMVWPAIVSETMASTGYRQEPPDPDAEFKYGNVYRQELERVRKIINPFDEKTKKGLIYAPEGILPKAQDDNWTMIGPPVDRMWDAQEDIWLLTSIMQAIAAVNKDYKSIIDAPVKAIQEVSLRGGSKVAPPKPAQNAGGEGEQPSALPTPRTSANPATSAGDVSFNPAAEFGPEVVIAPAAPVGGQEEDDDGPGRSRKKQQTRKAKRNVSSAAPTNSVRRYIEDDSTKGFKTRGFYIRVVMDHTFVPELVSQLSNMPWPTEIARVQQSDQVTRDVVAGRVEAAASNPAGFGAAPGMAARGPANLSRLNIIVGNDEEEEEKQQAEEEKKRLLVSPTKGSGLAGMAVEKDLVNAALEDPYVGLVVIAGTMTIYNQPTEAPKKPQPTQQQAQPKPADAQQQNKQPNPASPPAKQGNANPQQKPGNANPQQKPGDQAPKQGNSQKQANPPPKQGSQQSTQNNPPPKQANPPTALPKQGGNPASSQAKQPASESKAAPNAQTAGKKPQPDAPAKPPTPGDKK